MVEYKNKREKVKKIKKTLNQQRQTLFRKCEQ